jgi:glycosyltransferase involved in cell wall biosynthesis
MKRLRLVLSLYACEPNRGSEPGMGWAWALGMAKRHETYVLTRANNRAVIEAELARLKLPASEAPNFIYVDLPPFVCRLKKRGIIPIGIYYLLWQFKARSSLDALNINADIIHHATFCSFVIPGMWWNRKEKVVLGPLGGMSVCRRAFLRLFSRGRRVREFLRGIFRRCFWRLNPFFLLSRRNADALLFTEESILKVLSGKQASYSSVLLDVGVPQDLEAREYDLPLTKKKQFVWAGILEPRKGLEIALKAYAKAFVTSRERPVFKIMGVGSGLKEAQKLAHKLGVIDDVKFLGKVPQSQLWEEMRQSMAFVFTSVRDTSGSVILEAMACQCPIVCFNHQGAGMITDDTCAIRVEPSDWGSAINDFAEAMRQLYENPERMIRMGQAGRNRVLANFTWGMKFDLATEVYHVILKEI